MPSPLITPEQLNIITALLKEATDLVSQIPDDQQPLEHYHILVETALIEELKRELEALSWLVVQINNTDDQVSLESLCDQFKIRCKIRNQDCLQSDEIDTDSPHKVCNSCLSFSANPEGITNKIYFELAKLFSKQQTLGEIVQILMPQVTLLLIPKWDDGKLEFTEKPIAELSEIPADTNIFTKFTMLPPYAMDMRTLASYSFDEHQSLYEFLEVHYPKLTARLYEHNRAYRTMHADIKAVLGKKETIREAIFNLILALRKGGERVTDNSDSATPEAWHAYNDFKKYVATLPKGHKTALNYLTNEDQTESFIETMAHLEANKCVEQASNQFESLLKDNPAGQDSILDIPIPALTAKEQHAIRAKYAGNKEQIGEHKPLLAEGIDTTTTLPLTLLRSALENIDFDDWATYIDVLTNFPLEAYADIFKYTNISCSSDLAEMIKKNYLNESQLTAIRQAILNNVEKLGGYEQLLPFAASAQDAGLIQDLYHHMPDDMFYRALSFLTLETWPSIIEHQFLQPIQIEGIHKTIRNHIEATRNYSPSFPFLDYCEFAAYCRDVLLLKSLIESMPDDNMARLEILLDSPKTWHYLWLHEFFDPILYQEICKNIEKLGGYPKLFKFAVDAEDFGLLIDLLANISEAERINTLLRIDLSTLSYIVNHQLILEQLPQLHQAIMADSKNLGGADQLIAFAVDANDAELLRKLLTSLSNDAVRKKEIGRVFLKAIPRGQVNIITTMMASLSNDKARLDLLLQMAQANEYPLILATYSHLIEGDGLVKGEDVIASILGSFSTGKARLAALGIACESGETPFSMAVTNENEQVVRAILESVNNQYATDADRVKLFFTEDKKNSTPFTKAIFSNKDIIHVMFMSLSETMQHKLVSSYYLAFATVKLFANTSEFFPNLFDLLPASLHLAVVSTPLKRASIFQNLKDDEVLSDSSELNTIEHLNEQLIRKMIMDSMPGVEQFPWDSEQNKQVLSHLADLHEYGYNLQDQGVEKGEKLVKLASELYEDLYGCKTFDETIQKAFLVKLHRHDAEFKTDRIYSGIIGNILIAVGLLGVGYLAIAGLNWAITGHFRIFKTQRTYQVQELAKVIETDFQEISDCKKLSNSSNPCSLNIASG